jgi:hypothetical protein
VRPSALRRPSNFTHRSRLVSVILRGRKMCDGLYADTVTWCKRMAKGHV